MLEWLPETEQLLDELVDVDRSIDLEVLVGRMGEVAQRIVPDLVGMSLGLVQEGITLTLVATDSDAAGLDAVQYLDDEGPCVAASATGDDIDVNMADLLDEDRWALYARASAAQGVASSLSMPLVQGGRAYGGINLYASSVDAFTGHHEELAEALGASVAFAVTNADLSFSTRRQAQQAPARMRERFDVDTAVGMLIAKFQENPEAARERLRAAAARAGIPEALVARVLILLQDD